MGRSVPGDEYRVVCKAHHLAFLQHFFHGVLDLKPVLFIQDTKHFLKRPPQGLIMSPPRHPLGHRVEQNHSPLRIRADDGVANALQGDGLVFEYLACLGLGPEQHPVIGFLVALPGQEADQAEQGDHDSHEDQQQIGLPSPCGEDLLCVLLGHEKPGGIGHRQDS